MYTDVVEYQCDPSGAVDVMDTCRNSGPAGKHRIGNYLTASSRVCNFHLTVFCSTSIWGNAWSCICSPGNVSACQQH